jgi:hypothetical protein
MRNTLLPCSVGRADVRITDAWICSEAEKEAKQKASAMRNEWLLLWEAEGCYCIALCVGIAKIGGAKNCSIELLKVSE